MPCASFSPSLHKRNTKAPSASRPRPFLSCRSFSRLSLQVSPTVIWFILEHIGNLTDPFVSQVQGWRLLALGTRRMPSCRRTTTPGSGHGSHHPATAPCAHSHRPPE